VPYSFKDSLRLLTVAIAIVGCMLIVVMTGCTPNAHPDINYAKQRGAKCLTTGATPEACVQMCGVYYGATRYEGQTRQRRDCVTAVIGY
jgi:hypothetical protein